MSRIVVIFITIMSSGLLFSQDIETIKFKPKLGISGGINLSSSFYSVKGISARRSPFSWVGAGNLRFKAGIINIPVSFSFRDQQFSYGASFNKFGMSPYYKWAKLHLGHRTMRFSKYSMSGKNFFGVGVDLTPGKFRLSAFRGNIRNPLAVRDTSVYGAVLLPTYKRKALGVKLGFGSRSNHFDLIFLNIKDDSSGGEIDNSNFNTENISIDLDPAENLVFGTEWQFRLFKKLTIRGSVNASAFTENALLQSRSSDEPIYRFFEGMTTVNSSTKASIAGDAGASLNLGLVRLGIDFRRIEPNYRSLGIPYIQNDIQATMVSAGLSLFKQKLIIDARTGIEKNNLRTLDYTGRRRILTSVRLTATPIKDLMINANHSNYQYETVDGLVEINDTLRYINVNQTTSLNASYSIKSDEFSYGAFGTIVWQVVKDQSPISRITNDIINNNINLGVRLNWKPMSLTVKPSINYSKFVLVDRTNTRYGLGVNVSKGIMDRKLSISYNTRLSFNDVNSKRNGHIWSNKVGLNYKINEHNTLVFNTSFFNKKAIIGKTFNEFRSTASYGYRF